MTLPLSLTGLPSWAPAAGAAAAIVAVLVVVAGLRRSGWLSGVGPQSVVALGGVAVSVHGLWGFATGTAALSAPLAVAFIGVFDAAEMVLLVMLYRAADPAVGWTRELRLMHRTAWLLVGFSAAMNAIHAPNWWSRPVLAAIPALATWLIELQLRAKLGTGRTHEDEETGRPGPARLVLLVWQHGWARLFAALGLDARTSGSHIARAALAQKAARRLYRLRLTLEAPGTGRAAQRRRTRRRRAAQSALDRADVATDTGQALAMARRMAALTRSDEVATLNYANADAVLDLIEGLAVTPAADHAAATSRAAEAEAARQRAEAARQEAESARQRAEDTVTAAREEVARLEEQQKTLRSQQRSTTEQSHDARQRAEAAREEIATARQRAEGILSAARQEAASTAEAAQRRLAELQEATASQRAALQETTDSARRMNDETERQQAELEQLNAHIAQARTVHDRLRGELAALSDGAPAGDGPLFRSEAKQAGWQDYLQAVERSGGQAEPTPGEFAERFGIDPGNARNWVRDFRAAHAAHLAARQPRAAAHTLQEAAV